ncbi:MAG: hypothetical protein ABL931_23535, partial [Usitatibacteraceae bacterium]
MTYLTLSVAVTKIHFSTPLQLDCNPHRYLARSKTTTWRGIAMIHFVLHEATDTVAVAVVEGIKPGAELTAWIMDDDKQFPIRALQEIPIGHKIAL